LTLQSQPRVQCCYF